MARESLARPWFAPWPSFADDEVEAAARVLRSGKVNYWTGGEGRAFEEEYAAAVGRRHGLTTSNGTTALEAALAAFEVGPGDEVITSSRTFVASAACAATRGATPVCADVERDGGVVTPETLEAVRTERTRAVIVVHLGGWPCDMPAIVRWARQHELIVIEDCAQAHGATIGSRPVGAFGDAAAFSFCQDKIVTTGGEGGMLLLDDEDAWRRAWSLRDHGKDPDLVFSNDHEPGFRWLVGSFGTNLRMTEPQAAIGRLQLARLDDTRAARAHRAELLRAGLTGVPGLRLPRPPEHVRHAWYRFYAYVEPDALSGGWSRDRIMTEVAEAGVPVSVGGCSEIYLEQAFARAGLGPAQRHPVAAELGETSLALLVHPTLSAEAIGYAADVLAGTLRTAVR